MMGTVLLPSEELLLLFSSRIQPLNNLDLYKPPEIPTAIIDPQIGPQMISRPEMISIMLLHKIGMMWTP